MSNDCQTDSRRRFLQAAIAGAIGVSTGAFATSRATGDRTSRSGSSVGKLAILSDKTVSARAVSDLHVQFIPCVDLRPGAKLWLFYDIRQGAALGQTSDPGSANLLSVRRSDKDGRLAGLRSRMPEVPRTLDLFPTAPEFLHLIEVTLEDKVSAGSRIDFQVQGWAGPQQPIAAFHFWLVVDDQAHWDFVATGFRRYHRFVHRGGETRVSTDQLLQRTLIDSLRVTGSYPSISTVNHRRTPGVFWGEFHGMVFNQRPLDDYYNYAKNVAKLDFCAPFWFSYNTCVSDVWNEVKEAAGRHNEPGRFVPIVGFECGTPPDDSHRCVIFRNPANVPPIFCDSRPPAREPFHQRRFHPDTVICRTLTEFYDTVEKFGGIVTGHLHTTTYDREVLAEIFQKNLTTPEREEQRIYELMRRGKRFALAGTSDTHDSMPGNPSPEPHLPMAAGFTGVYADSLTADSLLDAVLARRTFATSGTRMFMVFRSNDQPMGAELPIDAPRRFEIEIDGTAELKQVELLRDGRPVQSWLSQDNQLSVGFEDPAGSSRQSSFYHVRVTQHDGHQGWTSPIWFG